MNTTVGKVEKLEALLVRVQRNRTQPRNGAGASQGFAREASFEAAPAPQAPRPPVRPIAEPIAQSPATASRPARTPLEQAVENKLERPSTHPHLQAVPSPQSPAQSAASAPVPQPLSFAKAGAEEPSLVVDPPPPAATRSVGQVVSKQPLIASQSFGDLLRRSLSLRPR